MKSTVSAACIVLAATMLRGNDQMNIWPEASPELKGVAQEHIPTPQLFHGPESAEKKPAVLICPAGGYKHHSDPNQDVQWLNSLGIAAYVVNTGCRYMVTSIRHRCAMRNGRCGSFGCMRRNGAWMSRESG